MMGRYVSLKFKPYCFCILFQQKIALRGVEVSLKLSTLSFQYSTHWNTSYIDWFVRVIGLPNVKPNCYCPENNFKFIWKRQLKRRSSCTVKIHWRCYFFVGIRSTQRALQIDYYVVDNY